MIKTIIKECSICQKPFKATSWNQKYCSHECLIQNAKNKYFATNPPSGVSRNTMGAISELRVSVDLLARGFDVFRALSPACSCDLAVLKNGKLLKIEVRTAHRSPTGKLYRIMGKQEDTTFVDHYAWVLIDEIIYEPPLTLE